MNARLSICAAGWSLAVLGLVACDRSDPTHGAGPEVSRNVAIAPAATDQTMGNLSSLARHIAAALRDAPTRYALHDALVNAKSRGVGLDLTTCGSTGTANRLLTVGERRGAGSASAMCGLIHQSAGVILYMDPRRLARWDPSVSPIVTAVANPGHRIAGSFKGYRSPDVTIDLPGDGSLGGPILVVLPVPHPNQTGRAAHAEKVQARVMSPPYRAAP